VCQCFIACQTSILFKLSFHTLSFDKNCLADKYSILILSLLFAMPFPFVLPTTSHLTLQTHFTSSTHPSFPSAATSQRAILRSALKSHKRLSPPDQASNLPNIVASLNTYLKYLLSLDTALSGKSIAGEDVDIALTKEVEVEWRPTLSNTAVPGREADRVLGRGLDYEIYFTLQTLSTTYNLLARQSLLALYSSTNPSSDQRLSSIQSASKSLKSAYSIHAHLLSTSHSADHPPSFPLSTPDIHPTIQSALQGLTHAELNLLAVLKDDPYPALLIQSRNKSDREWMIRAPSIPKVRASVLTRLCLGAAAHSSAALAQLKPYTTASKDLQEYLDALHRVSRAKACRFLAIDAGDNAGQTGLALAYLGAAHHELGLDPAKPSSGIAKLKSSWTERREDKKISRGSADWGADAGKAEEARILAYLQTKLEKENSTISIQVVPEWRPLLAQLPSGMNLPVDAAWRPVVLAEEDLVALRGVGEEVGPTLGMDSSDDELGGAGRVVAGAFPVEGRREYY